MEEEKGTPWERLGLLKNKMKEVRETQTHLDEEIEAINREHESLAVEIKSYLKDELPNSTKEWKESVDFNSKMHLIFGIVLGAFIWMVISLLIL